MWLHWRQCRWHGMLNCISFHMFTLTLIIIIIMLLLLLVHTITRERSQRPMKECKIIVDLTI